MKTISFQMLDGFRIGGIFDFFKYLSYLCKNLEKNKVVNVPEFAFCDVAARWTTEPCRMYGLEDLQEVIERLECDYLVEIYTFERYVDGFKVYQIVKK